MTYKKLIKKWANKAEKQGFKVSHSKHYKFTNPRGQTTSISGTPKNPDWAQRVALKDLLAIGFQP